MDRSQHAAAAKTFIEKLRSDQTIYQRWLVIDKNDRVAMAVFINETCQLQPPATADDVPYLAEHAQAYLTERSAEMTQAHEHAPTFMGMMVMTQQEQDEQDKT